MTPDGKDGVNGADGVGIVDIDIKYGKDEKGNQTITYTFVMSDGSKIVKVVAVPKQVRDVYISSETPVWLTEEVKNDEINLNGIFWCVNYMDGTQDNIPVTADQIVKESIGGGVCYVEASYGEYKGSFQVYVADSLDGINFEQSYLYRDGSILCKVNGELDSGNNFVVRRGRVQDEEQNEIEVSRTEPLTADMLENFDNTECGGREFQVKEIGETVTVYIYAEKVERVDYNPDRRIVKAVKDGVPELSIRKTSTIALLDNDGNEFMSVSEGEEKEIKLTAEMIDGEVDFATVGEKKFTVTIDGEKIDLVVTVYDPAITNIRDMWVEDSHIEIPMNTSKEDAAKMR